MRLCDDCIQKLTEDLSSETKKILDNKVLPLMSKRETVSGKELAKTIGLDRTGVKQVIEELKTHLLIDYFYRGRKRVYKLTNTANRYYKLQQNPDLAADAENESQVSSEENSKQQSDSKEKLVEEETVTKQKADDDKQEIKPNPAEEAEDTSEDNEESLKEEPEKKEVETTEAMEEAVDDLQEERSNNSETKVEEEENNSDEQKDLVWNIT